MAEKYILISFATSVGRSRKLISLANITEVSELPSNGGISIKTSFTTFTVKNSSMDDFMSFLVSDENIFDAAD